MLADINLKEIERKAWRSFYQDGLMDIYLGLILMASGVSGVLLRTDAPAPWPMAAFLALAGCAWLLWQAGVRLISRPRLGRVKPGPTARARQNKTLVVSSICLGVTVTLVISTIAMLDGGRPADAGLFLLIAQVVTELSLLLFFGLGAYFLEYRRLYLIGILYAIGVGGILLYVMEDLDAAIFAAFAAAALIVIMGTVVFVRFLRSHPVPTVEKAAHDQQ